MSLYLIEPPDETVISLADAKKHLRVTTTDNDGVIQAMLDAAVAQLDPASGGWLGRALRPQIWELRLPGFPCGAHYRYPSSDIELPYPPLIEVVSFKYDDSNGAEQTLAANTGYRVLGIGTLGKACVAPPYNGSWPSARNDGESVRIRFNCGYESDADVVLFPAPIRQAILLALSHFWGLSERNLFLSEETIQGVSTFRWTVSDAARSAIMSASDNLLSAYRQFG